MKHTARWLHAPEPQLVDLTKITQPTPVKAIFRAFFPTPTVWQFIGRNYAGALMFRVDHALPPAEESIDPKLPRLPRIIGIPPSVFWEGVTGPDGVKLYAWADR